MKDLREELLRRLWVLVERVRDAPARDLVLAVLQALQGSGPIATSSRVSTEDPLQVAFAKGDKMVRTRFAKWMRGLLAEAGTPYEGRAVEALATLWGELFAPPDFELRVVSGDDIPVHYEKFEDVSGLSSCMTERPHLTELYARIPGLELWIAMQRGKPVARVLVWHDVIDASTGEQTSFMDRIYASSSGARDWLLEIARQRGMKHRPAGAGYLEFDGSGYPKGENLLLHKETGIWDRGLKWPYMDSFAWASYEGNGWVLSTYRRPESTALLRHTDGTYAPVEPPSEPAANTCLFCGEPVEAEGAWYCPACEVVVRGEVGA